RRAWDAARLLLKIDRAFGVPRPLDNCLLFTPIACSLHQLSGSLLQSEVDDARPYSDQVVRNGISEVRAACRRRSCRTAAHPAAERSLGPRRPESIPNARRG